MAIPLGLWWRSWRRSPLLTAQYVLTLAIGMGAAAAVVSLMLALGYQPLPYRDPYQLVSVWERIQAGAPVGALSPPDLADFRSGTTGLFSDFGGFTMDPYWLLDRHGAAQVGTFELDPDAMAALGMQTVQGRPWRPGDPRGSESGTAPAWISSRLWRARYGGSPGVIGTSIGLALDAQGNHEMRFQIAGVLPLAATLPLPFASGDDVDVWYVMPDLSGLSRQSYGLFGLGRLLSGGGTFADSSDRLSNSTLLL